MFSKIKKKTYFSITLIVLFLSSLSLSSILTNSSDEGNIFFVNDENIQPYSSKEYKGSGEVLSAQEFSLMIDEADTDNDGNVDIVMENDVDLSDFSNSPLNSTTYNNEYAIHGFNNLNIDFNGHTVTNKTQNYTSNDLNENSQNVTTSLTYQNDWTNYNLLDTTDASYYYLYWFYDIDNLTLTNGNFINVPLVAYDIGTLTIDNFTFSNAKLTNIYFSSSENDVEIDPLPFKHTTIGLIADQVSNMNLSNIVVSNYSMSQNVFNFTNNSFGYYFNVTLGIFTRIGEDTSSVINVDNVAFDDISFNSNERGLQSNDDAQVNVGVFSALKGNIYLNDLYFNNVSFVLNNDLNPQRNNSLVSIVETDLVILEINNVFVGNIFSTAPTTTRIFGTGYEYDEESLNDSIAPIGPSDILEVNSFIDEITYIEYTISEKEEIILENHFPPSLVTLNSFVDTSNTIISYEESKQKDYFESNFDSKYYKLEEGEFATPISVIEVETVEVVSSWKTIEISTSLISGFQPQTPTSTYIIEITNDTENKIVDINEFNVGTTADVSYVKSFGERTDEYSYNIYLGESSEPLTVSTSILVVKFPAWLITLLAITFILLVLLILLILFLFMRKTKSTSIALVNETAGLSAELYEPEYDKNNISGYYEYLGLKDNSSFKKVQNIYNKNLVKWDKDKISREEFDNVHIAYIAIEEYIRGGQ